MNCKKIKLNQESILQTKISQHKNIAKKSKIKEKIWIKLTKHKIHNEGGIKSINQILINVQVYKAFKINRLNKKIRFIKIQMKLWKYLYQKKSVHTKFQFLDEKQVKFSWISKF